MSAAEASLPMYNLPEMAGANGAFWRALAEKLRSEGLYDLPEGLTFKRPAVPNEIGPQVFFTQTCGYPLQTIYKDQYKLLGVPTYDAPGCGEATHRAFVLVRDDAPFKTLADLRGAVFAVNSEHSNSGMNLPRILFARLAGGKPFFREIVKTGGHPASIEQVTAGKVDAASIDCMTYAFFQDHKPEAVSHLRILAETPASPAIPFITSIETSDDHAAVLRRSLLRLVADPLRRDMLAKLRIRNITPADPSAYRHLLEYEREAAALGYAELT